jgi:hypothetical protein
MAGTTYDYMLAHPRTLKILGWEAAEAFSEMHRVLKKGGHTVIADVTIPALFRHLSNWIAQFCKEGDEKVYSADELELMLREVGFVENRLEHVSFMAVVVSAGAGKEASIRRALPRFLRKPRCASILVPQSRRW